MKTCIVALIAVAGCGSYIDTSSAAADGSALDRGTDRSATDSAIATSDTAAPDAATDAATTTTDSGIEDAQPADAQPADLSRGAADLSPPGMPRSCKELHAAQPGLPDGVYTVAPEGDNGLPQPFKAWCDMTTDGGGWTMLLNPSGKGLPAMVPIFGFNIGVWEENGRPCAMSSGWGPFEAHGWQGIRTYGCGTVTLRLTFNTDVNKRLQAKDIMFVATAQSWQTRGTTINGKALPADAVAPQGGCAFWNGTGKASAPPSPNSCWAFALPEPPHVYKGAIDGAAMMMLSITVGPAGMPDPSYGTGANVQRLGVR